MVSANKRVSFIQSLLADPEKKKKLMVDSIIATQAREGIKTTREQAEAAYAKAQSRPNSSRIESSPVAPKRVELSRAGREGNGNGSVPWQSGGTRHSKTTAEGSGVVRPDGRRPVVADSEGRLDHIQEGDAMQATNEDKALEILRLIFSGRLDKENSKAVKQVADIIGRK